MRVAGYFAALAAFVSFGAMAAPSPTVDIPSKILDERQGGKCTVVTPTPCAYISPPPTEEETAARHKLFADAFVVQKNLSEAFKYIDAIYTVGPMLSPSQFRSVNGSANQLIIVSRTTTRLQLRRARRRHWVSWARYGAHLQSRHYASISRATWAGSIIAPVRLGRSLIASSGRMAVLPST